MSETVLECVVNDYLTFIVLLFGLFCVAGNITIDGVDTKDMTRENVHRKFGMVLQDTWIKNGTVRENIAFGKPDATDEEIIAAAKASHAHSFIKRMPQGYDTVISDENSGLSQGQKQLLCIARVMLGGENGELPPMLILDEATSALDTESERLVQEALERLMKSRTTIAIAHRLSTIKNADEICVLYEGEIVERGKHEELIALNGYYKKLNDMQSL